MPGTSVTETDVEDDFEREKARLLKRAEEKPTLRMIDAKTSRPIEEWERLYPDKWLLIEVTRADEWEVYEGKLIAIADDSIEFVEIGRSYHDRGIANLTTRGAYTEPQPAFVG